MLQIISGRFFGNGDIEEKDQDAILYSNYSWIFPVATQVVEMRPCDMPGKSISSYVLRFRNRYEKFPGDIRVLASPDQAVDQFRMLCALWFRAFFHEDRAHVEHLCRSTSRGSHDTHVPTLFVPRIFDAGLFGNLVEADGFPPFLAKVLRMPRKKYRLLMSCLETYLDSLEAIGTNFDLAYSMMVYALEALSQNEDGYVPTWGDYPEQIRISLDSELAQIDEGRAENIRQALLGSAHLKLMKRFVAFTTELVSEEFFTVEPGTFGIGNALGRSKLGRALVNLYNTRSGYVHELKRIRDQLSIPRVWTEADIFEWEHEPYLTYPGLVRLVRHVLMNFVTRQPELEHEEYPGWRGELPGTITMMAAPRYWIWQANGFTPETARSYLGGFLDHLAGLASEEQKAIPNLDEVMKVIEARAATSKRDQRRSMLCLYWLYQSIIPPEAQLSSRESFLSRYESEALECSIETMAVYCYSGINPAQWSAEQCASIYETYERARYARTALHLSRTFEVALMAFIANRFLLEGDGDASGRWVDRAVLDAAGATAVQNVLREAKSTSSPVDIRLIFGQTAASDASAVNDAAPDPEAVAGSATQSLAVHPEEPDCSEQDAEPNRVEGNSEPQATPASKTSDSTPKPSS